MFAENRFTNLPHFPLDIPWFPVQLAPQGAIGAIDSYIEYWGNGFSIGPDLRPGQFIVLKCLSVCLSVCVSVPIYLFEASHWPSDHMTRPRPLIG